MKVLVFINSVVGKAGNIGARFPHVLTEILAQHGECAGYARGTMSAYRNEFETMGILGLLPRALNAVRIYAFRNFPAKKLDRRLFESWALRKLKKEQFTPETVALVGDYCPKLLRELKQRGVPTLLDVAIAPTKYSNLLNEKGFVSFSERFLSEEIELEQRCFDLADRIIAPSNFVAETVRLYANAAYKIEVIEFGSPSPATIVSPPKEPKGLHFVFAGVINSRKGIRYLLEAFSDDLFKGDTLHLCGRLFPEAKKLLKRMQLKNVLLPGFIDTLSYFPRCHVYVLPTLMEGSSKSIYEALACGLPVITTENAGSVVRHGVEGLIVPIGSASALRESLLFFKRNPERLLAMSEAAKNRAIEFSWPRYAKRVTALLASNISPTSNQKTK